MANIFQLPLPIAANTGVLPNIKTMTVGDNLTTVTTAGYLNAVNLQGYPLSNGDILNVLYSFNQQTGVGTYGIFAVSISNGVITLVEDVSEGNVVLPTIANHIATYVGTDGRLTEDPATAISGGNIQAGLSGTQGKLIFYPPTAASGHNEIAASDNTNSAVGTLLFDQVQNNTTFHLTSPIITPNLYIQVSDKAGGLASDIKSFTKTVTATNLSGGAFSTLLLAEGTGTQFVVLTLSLSGFGTNFSGGGGNRNLAITDGTTVYSVIPAATLQALANNVWGSVDIPFPASAGMSTPTASNASLYAVYSGGTTDYSAGSVVISGIAHRIL